MFTIVMDKWNPNSLYWGATIYSRDGETIREDEFTTRDPDFTFTAIMQWVARFNGAWVEHIELRGDGKYIVTTR